MRRTFPVDALEHVLSFLCSADDRNAVSLVCKSWCSTDRWFRRRIVAGDCCAVSPETVVRRFPALRAFELKAKPNFAEWLAAMAAAYPLLEEIKLEKMMVTDESLEIMAKSFENLEVLMLLSCKGFSTDGLALIAANCRKLRELDLKESEIEESSGNWLGRFPDNCTSLVSLDISCFDSEVSFSGLECLIARCPNLRTLRLGRVVPFEKIPDILRLAPHLVELELRTHATETWTDILPAMAEALSRCRLFESSTEYWDVEGYTDEAIFSVTLLKTMKESIP